ncbi:hypothetical protein TVAG_165420 [Trichomonas vaginalis G3]|uniref:Uncharacterized protein n=1 Tax=Trichomonas vaginalis (strain ATCC PRA-98 / G3) TaxID=412133 RepID=A2DUM3_TRIV3|nr:hypothetical protein TVAGG3_0662820 [Trichomonas vaginalis G3]EAY15914.1 hypothetical protein TVAG_165420 [Trichomonas vaginalis G3]KAI5506625.1 hypothetical protein TVAGG3_0662820 [Trichomonas vaginalis G3]|eukprot:XP_001328137.1 hypothetical protein [Trichomonas vaginalis G3]
MFSLLVQRANVRTATDFYFWANILFDGIDMTYVLPTSWSTVKGYINEFCQPKIPVYDIYKKITPDPKALDDYYEKSGYYFVNTTSLTKFYGLMGDFDISPIVNNLYANKKYIKDICNILEFDGDRIEKLIINLKENPDQARLVDLLEGMKLGTNYIYDALDIFNFMMTKKDTFLLQDVPGHIFFECDAVMNLIADIPEIVSNDYITIAEIMREINYLIDFGINSWEANKLFIKHTNLLLFEPIIRMIPKNAKDVIRKVKNIIQLYDDIIADSDLPEEVKEFTKTFNFAIEGLKMFIDKGFSIESVSMLVVGFEYAAKVTRQGKPLVSSYNNGNFTGESLGTVIRAMARSGVSMKELVMAIG